VELTAYVQSAKTPFNLLDITILEEILERERERERERETGDADVNWVEVALDIRKRKDYANKALKIRFVKTAYS
jgi:hypothetical protein